MKKSTKGLISTLLLFAMCGAVGCNKTDDSSSTVPTNTSSSVEQVVTVDLLNRVVDGGDGVYTLTKETDGVKVAFNKNADTHEWSSLKVDLTAADQMSKMKTLKFAFSGQGTVVVKVEGPSGNVEVKNLLSTAKGAYELSLAGSADKISDATAIYLFAAPGLKESAGEFKIHELTLTSALADNYTIVPGWTNVPDDANAYDGTTDTFNFNSKWTENDAGTYTFDYANGITTVNYTKSDKYTWAFASTKVTGDFSKFDYVTFKVKGTADKQVLFKVEPAGVAAKEQWIVFNGDLQTITFDLSGYTAADKQKIDKVLMFAEPNVAVNSSFELHAAYFTTKYEGTNISFPVDETKDVLEYTSGTSFDVNDKWHDAGDEVYTVGTERPLEVTYTAENKKETSALRTQISGAFKNFTKFKFGIEVAQDKEVLVQIGKLSRLIKGNDSGNPQGFELNLSLMNDAELNALKEIVIIAEPGVANVAGSFKIHWMGFDGFKACTYDGSSRVLDVNRYLNEQETSFYNIVEANGKTEISWSDREETSPVGAYTSVKTIVQGDCTNLTELSYSVTIPAGRKVLLKLDGTGAENPKVENWLDNSAGVEEKTFSGVFDYSSLTVEQRKALNGVLVFPVGGVDTTTAGKITINELRLTRPTATVDENGKLDFNSEFVYNSNMYGHTVEDDTLTVTYAAAKGEWDSIQSRIAYEGYTKATIVVTGTSEKQILFKVENEFNGGENKEHWHTLNGEQQTVEFNFSDRFGESKPKSIVFCMFAEGGKTGVTGSYTVHSITFSK